MSEHSRSGISRLAASALMPQEAMVEVHKQEKKLLIGIPKETSFQENRIPLVPEAVAQLTANGHEIIIEAGAGAASNFQDSDFSEAGARIVYSVEEVFQCDVVLKVAPPSEKELDLLKTRQTLVSILQMSMQNEQYVRKLSSKKITAIGYEFMHDDSGVYPIIQAMSEIVGSACILIAAEYMSNAFNGKGELLGGVAGIPPTEVVIIGAGTVGEYAARAALGLGATVKVFDNSVQRLRRIQNHLGNRIFTSTIVPSILLKELKHADVAIGALRSSEGRTPVVVTDEMVSEMQVGSVIVDVSIDQGGCFETSEVTNHSQPVFRKYGVVHYCVPNIASRVSRTASTALSNIFTPMLINAGEVGGLDELLWKDKLVRRGVYMFRGSITNRYVADASKLPYKDLDLLQAARI
ncbi:MAG: alanine dehydrogenase [Bacteroidota bacterium]|jgi:alanine dehydrogenase|uniref:alanine dehydrogenase n=1 Tax=Candidatus Pollutiaquabacter sp. TaxID=3416354 RepID=UPI001B67D872|nr:alanine dehydrogenase [Bacteroidota bacterium]MBP6009896.1 alanine dehydrogenase [Bacteroidia bacterium]MBP7438472.1 alanine dehydrogenase [Bacteroidia bacterium]MBP7772231.1 alanine dehydrogenase [Bacteroidia bacterium]HPD52871.1 alanine dehydrogenase [Bacteroidia bacterium]